MKIMIQDKEESLNFTIPNWLLTGVLARKLIVAGTQKYCEDMLPCTAQQLDRILVELKKAGRRFKGLRLVEVQSQNGDYVVIEL